MKHLKLFFALFAMLALSVGNAWAEVYFEDSFSNVGTGSNATVSSRTGWTSLTQCYGQYNSGLRIGSSKNAGTLTKTAMTNISGTKDLKVTIYTAKYSSDGNSFTITTTNGTITSVTGVGKLSNGTLTVSPANNAGVTSTTAKATWKDAHKTEFIISGATSSTTIKFATNKRAILGPVTIEDAASEGDDDEIEEVDLGDLLKWSTESATATMGADNNEFPILTNTNGVDVTYTSSTPATATIDATGNITLVAAGTTTISAFYEGGDDAGDGKVYAAKTVSYTLTVKPAPLVIEPIEGGIIDILTHKTFGVTSNSYTSFSGKQATNDNHSDAVYAGKTARNGNATQYNIQLNLLKDGRQFATTTSGGIAKRVYVKWATQTANVNARTLDIYGSNTAYTGSETSTSTTKIGAIKYTTGAAEAYVDLTGDYKYILMTGSGAIYMDEIQVTWVVAEGTVTTPTIPGVDEFIESTEVTISAEDGLKVYYTLDGTDPTNASTEYTAPFELTATTTIKAVAYDGENASDIVSKTFKKLQVLTCEEAAELCADTESADKYVIRGYVTNIVNAWSDQYSNISFWMADTKNGGQVFEAYRAQPVAAADKAVKVGDYVEVIGKIVLYGTTPETTQGGTYTIIPAPVVNHTITVSANPAEAGTVTGAGEYEEGATATLTATANEGYEFVNWTENEVKVSTDAEYTFEVLADHNLVANFKKKTYTVTATATNGTVTGLVEGGIYEHGATATLTATPAFDYQFVNWSNGSTENPLTITVTDNVTLEANFAEVAATEKKESGVFSISAHKTATFATGNLQHNVGTGEWRFAKQQYQVVGEQNIQLGHPDFKDWIDMFGYSADGEYGVNPSNNNADYTKQFVDWGTLFPEEGWSTLSKEDWKYLLEGRTNAAKLQQVAKVGDILGIMLFPDNWTLPEGCTPTEGTNHDPDDGEETKYDFTTQNYTLEQWTKLEEAGAVFLPAAGRRTGGWGNTTLSENVPGGVLDAEGHYKHFDNCNEFAYYWTSTKVDEDVYYLFNCRPVDKPNNVYSVGAAHVDWAEKGRYGQSVRLAKVVYDKHTVNATAENGTVTGADADEYTHGTEITLTAIPAEHYVFVNWTKGEEVVAETAEYTFTVEADVELVANFKLDSHTVAANAENGTVTGAGEYAHGKEVTLTAAPAEHYVFVNWTKGEEVVSTENPYTFNVTADVALVANFAKKTYTVTATATNGTVEGAGTYEHAAEVTLTATAAEGYEFVNWTSGETVVSTENPYKFTVTADVDLVANFQEKVVAPTKLYLTPNANWKQSNARFAAYFFGNGETWVSMTKVAGEADLYEVTIPTDKKYPNVIFCRMNPGTSANNWNDGVKWNQTADLVIPTDGKNHYTVTAGTWDKGGGTWSIWPVPVVKTYKDITITVIANATPKIHYWEGGDKMVGSSWENKPEMVATGEENTYSYTIKDVDELTGVKYLVVVGDIQSADQITYVNVTKNFKEFLPQVAVQGVNNWDGTDKMTVSDDYLTASITLPLEANKQYDLKLTVNGDWFGGKTIAITKDKNSAKFDTNGDGNGKITTDLAGGYVFTYTYATKTLTVAYPVSVTATAENGTVEGAGIYTHGTEVTLIATPAEGYEFVNWTVAGEEVTDEATYTFVAKANVKLVANFKKHETTINIEPGNGKLSGAIATAFPGDTIILADGEYTEEKSFKLNKAGVIVKADEGAKPVIKASSYMQHYATITFIGITFDGQNTAEYTVYSYENTSKNLTFKDCEFTGYTYYNICQSSSSHVDSLIIDNCLFEDNGYAAIYYTNPASGVITCSYAKITNTTIYNVGDPNHDTGIIDIREGVSGANENEIIIDHVTIYNFKNPAGFGAIMPYKSGNVVVSNSIVMNPETTSSYAFRVYNGAQIQNTLYFNCNPKTDGGAIYTNCLNVDPLFVDADNGNFALMPLSPARGAATYGSDLGDPRWYTSVNKYTVNATANPAEAGTVSGAGEYIEGVAVTLVATPERGYSFVNWTVEGEEVSTEATYTFTPSADIELVANFEEIEFTGNIINVEPGKGTLATAVKNAEAGDKIVLADGTYNEAYSIAFNKENIVVMAAEGAKPVIQLTDTFTVLEVSATTTFDGITFDATNVAYYIIAALDSEEMDAELTIINCEFKNWTLWAISNQYANNVSVRSVVIDNCLFHDGTGAAISFSNNAPAGKQACEYFEMTNSTLYKISESSYRGIINVGSNPEAEGDYNTVVIDHITMYDYTLTQSGIAAIAIRKTHNLKISNSIIANPEDNDKTALNVYGGTVDNTIHYNGTKRSGSTVYTNCYNTDPMFTHAEHGIFCLQEGSPAIGAATDRTNLGDPRWNTPHYLVELSVNKEEAGTVEGAGVYKHGETVTVVAYAKPDYVFNAWADNYGENEEVADRIYTFTITEDVNLEAIFTEQPGAPGNPTDMENNIISNSQVMKVIQNGRLFIIREGKIYNAQGQVVK